MSRRAHWLALGVSTAALSCAARTAPTAADSVAVGAAAPAAAPGYSAASLYNRGNAYARTGRYGLAVLYYERALLLGPDDADVAANLRRVRENAKLPPGPQWGLERAARIASPTLLAWTGLGGLLLIAAAFLAGRWRPGHRWMRRSAGALGVMSMMLTVGNGVALWPLLHAGVVLTAATPVRVAPVPMGDPLFVLAEAETVTITGTHDEFVLIRTRTGRTGWVARVNLAAVVP